MFKLSSFNLLIHFCILYCLLKEYGEVEKGEAETKPDTLKSKLLSEIYYFYFQLIKKFFMFVLIKKAVYVLNESTNERIQRKIPYTIEIKRLKVLACNLFKSSGLDLDSIRLFYKSPQVRLNIFIYLFVHFKIKFYVF
jgi:hypothetical protein